MTDSEIVVVESPGVLAQQAARRFTQIVSEAIDRGGRATVALSGGSTPRALFDTLANPPYRGMVDWTRVHLFWGDERTVPPDHEESNFRMARETLIDKLPFRADHVHRMRGELDPAEAAADYERTIQAVFNLSEGEIPTFDLVLLGMGADGHTASLFPNTKALAEQDRLCVANEVPQMETTRITLTSQVLNAAANTLFLVAGADKAPAVKRAIEGPEDIEQTPCQLLRRSQGNVTWLLDTAAAAELNP